MTALPLKDFTPTDIRKIRIDFRAAQAAFAEILGVSMKTIEADPHFPCKYGLSRNEKDIAGPFDSATAFMNDLNDIAL